MSRRRSAGFSMMELIIAATVVVILASVAVAGYQGYRDRAAMLVDETNQKVLAAAVKLFAYDNNALPASLSELRPLDMERAYAAVTEGKRPYTLLAFLQESIGAGVAEAVPLPARYYSNNRKVLICPVDGTVSSYEIAPAFRGAPLRVLLSANGDSALIIEKLARHQGGTTKVITTVNGSHRREKTKGGGNR
jgi:type II secretory pathway pseudopilin PulG